LPEKGRTTRILSKDSSPPSSAQYDQLYQRDETLVRILCTDEVVTVIPKDPTEGKQSLSRPSEGGLDEFDNELFQDSSLLSTTPAQGPSPYLTSFDLLNRQRGYNTYLPTSDHQFELYWKLLFGIDVHHSSSSDYSPAFTVHHTPLMETPHVTKKSEPYETAQISSSWGPKIVPQCVLYSGCLLPPSSSSHRTSSW
jgi:hypothetical protein